MLAGAHAGGNVDAQGSRADPDVGLTAVQGLMRRQADDGQGGGALNRSGEGGGAQTAGLDQAIGGDDAAKAVGVPAGQVGARRLDRKVEGAFHGGLVRRAVQAQDGEGFVQAWAGRDHVAE